MEIFGSKILRLAKMHILDKFETLLKHEKRWILHVRPFDYEITIITLIVKEYVTTAKVSLYTYRQFGSQFSMSKNPLSEARAANLMLNETGTDSKTTERI